MGSSSYIIKASLNPNIILLFRKDGQKLSDEDRIPAGFLQSGISIATMEKSKKDKFFGDFGVNFSLTEDHQYLVIEFRVRRYEKATLEEKSESGIIRLARDFFNKNKKRFSK